MTSEEGVPEEAPDEKATAEKSNAEDTAAEDATADAVVAAWDVATRDENKHNGGRRGGKALLAEFLPNLRRRLPDCLTDQLERVTHAVLQRKSL